MTIHTYYQVYIYREEVTDGVCFTKSTTSKKDVRDTILGELIKFGGSRLVKVVTIKDDVRRGFTPVTLSRTSQEYIATVKFSLKGAASLSLF